jgi:ElaB/YqjD/DUF883 family membrane-anchored ribosome-binding protein
VDSELEVIRTEMEVTRGSLAQKIGELENQVRDTVSEASEAVSATKEGVKDVVSSVSDTITNVKESLEETFNFSKHIAENPWAAFGIAVAVGAAGGMFLRTPRVPHTSGFAPGVPALPPSSTHATASAAAAPSEPSMFDSVLGKLQGMALASLVDVVQDLVQQSAPESWRAGLHDIVRDVASKLTDEDSTTRSHSSSNGSY